MILEHQLNEIVKAQKENLFSKELGINRELSNDFKIEQGFASIVTGIRRCGKSTFLLQMHYKNKDKSFYLNFEDTRLINFTVDDFPRLKRVIDAKNSNLVLFDEIQIIPGWELFVRQLLDEGYKVVVTGSNAKMLSIELGTKLTGRHLSYELFPFSYWEYLDYMKIDNSDQSISAYLNKGGFPEYLKTGNGFILSQLLDDLIYRDIAVRFGVRNVKALKQLLIFLISNIGKPISANSLKKTLDIKSTTSILEYMSYLEQTYILQFLPKFSYSIKKQIRNPDKVYVIDLGLFSENALIFSPEWGRRLENLVFIHLRKHFKEIFYFSENNECDFVVKQKGKITSLFQVCYKLDEANMDREINGVLEAMKFFDLQQGYIITFDQNEMFTIDNKQIDCITMAEFLSRIMH